MQAHFQNVFYIVHTDKRIFKNIKYMGEIRMPLI